LDGARGLPFFCDPIQIRGIKGAAACESQRYDWANPYDLLSIVRVDLQCALVGLFKTGSIGATRDLG
jgi:hypothetical protein